MLEAIAAALVDAREELNQLDGAAGDGDLGLTGRPQRPSATLPRPSPTWNRRARPGRSGTAPGPPRSVDGRHAHRDRPASPRARSIPRSRLWVADARRPLEAARDEVADAARRRSATGHARRPGARRRGDLVRGGRGGSLADALAEAGSRPMPAAATTEMAGTTGAPAGSASERAVTRTRARGSSRSCSPPGTGGGRGTPASCRRGSLP